MRTSLRSTIGSVTCLSSSECPQTASLGSAWTLRRGAEVALDAVQVSNVPPDAPAKRTAPHVVRPPPPGATGRSRRFRAAELGLRRVTGSLFLWLHIFAGG